LNLGRLAAHVPLPVSRVHLINAQSSYQVLLLGVAAIVVALLAALKSERLWEYLRLGDLRAPAEGVTWLGIANGESWGGLGASLSLVMTLATLTFVYLQQRGSGARLVQLVPFLPWVTLVSVTNALSEEVIYRLGVVVPLAGSASAASISLLSAVAFGLPHLRGVPGGAIGALMAALMGWLLAKSVVETHGMAWAWLIHLLQDIVIFSAMVLTTVPRTSSTGRRVAS
jgi:membrane protease YdiL (CAAX protease family)